MYMYIYISRRARPYPTTRRLRETGQPMDLAGREAAGCDIGIFVYLKFHRRFIIQRGHEHTRTGN